MFVIQGPYPRMTQSLVLPSPRRGNSVGKANTLQVLRAMDGTMYTYVKSKRGRDVYRWDFMVARDKAVEVNSFIKANGTIKVKTTDHLDAQRIGFITINPLEMTGEGKALGWPGGEAYRFSIELEESK